MTETDELIADLRTLERIDGLHVGMLDADEMRVFKAAVKEGRAERGYSSAGALLMGIATVHMIRQEVR